MPPHLLIVPTLACPAGCKYCFGPHEGNEIMTKSIIEAIIQWQRDCDNRETLDITFHGGEPLSLGSGFYRMALPLLRDGLAPRRVRFGIQSNLWLIDDEICEIFNKYDVSIGTSLDGPEHINDAQRGMGYFEKTMAGIKCVRRHGLSVRCICTFTAQSAPYLDEIVQFFIREGLNFSIHPALASIRHHEADPWELSEGEYGELLVNIVDLYLENLDKIRIDTIDSLCRSISAKRGNICTFTDCLGDYLSVGPEGYVYPCQRFAGMPEYRLSNVIDRPSYEELSTSPVWAELQGRQDQIEMECGDCPYVDFCRGGCPYNAFVEGRGDFHGTLRDPYCPSYKRIYSTLIDRAMEEVFSEENLEAITSGSEPGILGRGRIVNLMKGGPHPYQSARYARRVLGAAALGASSSLSEALVKLRELDLMPNLERFEAEVRTLNDRLKAPISGLNNLYLHVTFQCPLQCTHCYAEAGPSKEGSLGVDDVMRACLEAGQLGFRHAVITGGEPLVHPRRDVLLDALAGIRSDVKPLQTVLRTNLAVQMDDSLLERVGTSTDEVVVSVDGDRETHDAQRGEGSYDVTVGNLREMVEREFNTKLSLATVLPFKLANGPPGNSVRQLAEELGIRRTRFKPILPLGRAADTDLEVFPETPWGNIDPREVVAYGFNPTSSCGIGQNLYVEPDGGAYPCYAWHGERWRLGYVNAEDGLKGVVGSPSFRELKRHTVDTNRRCGRCQLRYLCGGACRAWNRQSLEAQRDLDAPPVDCTPLYRRARSLLLSAMSHLKIPVDSWVASGLPLPREPPEMD